MPLKADHPLVSKYYKENFRIVHLPLEVELPVSLNVPNIMHCISFIELMETMPRLK